MADGGSTSRNAILEDSHGKYTYVWNSLSLSFSRECMGEARPLFIFLQEEKAICIPPSKRDSYYRDAGEGREEFAFL